MNRRRGAAVAAAVGAAVVLALSSLLVAARGDAGRRAVNVGAVFPVKGMQSALGLEELRGVRIAAQLVNQDGGVGGRPVNLVVRDLETREQAAGAVAAVKAAGAQVVVGAFSSQLSMPAAAAASRDGIVYW